MFFSKIRSLSAFCAITCSGIIHLVDSELEDIVKQMRDIVRQDEPYGNIPKLPDSEVLETEK